MLFNKHNTSTEMCVIIIISLFKFWKSIWPTSTSYIDGYMHINVGWLYISLCVSWKRGMGWGGYTDEQVCSSYATCKKEEGGEVNKCGKQKVWLKWNNETISTVHDIKNIYQHVTLDKFIEREAHNFYSVSTYLSQIKAKCSDTYIAVHLSNPYPCSMYCLQTCYLWCTMFS